MPLILTLRKTNELNAAPVLRADRGEIVIGRNPDASLVLADPAVSRRHCAIAGENTAWRITDSSSGGTFLNGQRLTGPQMLRHGDMLRVGAHEIHVGIEAGMAQPSARESWGRPAPGTMTTPDAGRTQAPMAAPLPASADPVLPAALSALIRLAQDRRKARADLGLAQADEAPLPEAQDLARQLAQMPPSEAAARIEAIYREIDAHQRAVLGAMQAGLHAALDQFAPEAIKHRARSDAEAWQAYEKAFAAQDGFVEIFAQALTRHYDQQVKAQQIRAQQIRA